MPATTVMKLLQSKAFHGLHYINLFYSLIQGRLKAWDSWTKGLGHNRGPRLGLNKITIRIISTVKCYFLSYSLKNWEFRTLCQLATCDDRRPCIGLGLSPYTNITHSVKRRQSIEPVCAISISGISNRFENSIEIEHHYWKVIVLLELYLRRSVKLRDGPCNFQGCGSPVVKVSDHGRHVMSSSPVPLKTRRGGQRCTLNLSRAQTSSRWCGVVVRERGCQLRCRPRHLTMVQNYVVRRPRVTEQCDVNIHSLTRNFEPL
ncbi:uncharacterized protein TNCV_4738221 [Trichonephila clavipes]|nr:uncharacterized protein TNCV_4738221 [Trichonephila clavipes]